MIKESFGKYMEEAIGRENALVAFSAFEHPASVSVRLNPFKSGGLGASAEWRPVPWSGHGRMLDSRPVFTLDPHFHAGAYYVQDSSSMFVGQVFRTMCRRLFENADGTVRRLRVLDLCAAPGGKTTDLAASLREMCGDDFLLVSNEVMKQRVGTLADNVALWGDPNVVVTSDDPRAFAALPGFFDVIVADVPCSGEGMFRKDDEAQRQWSEDNVALCEARQRRIVADVWPALASGGLFVYSTCTFNRYENDGNVEWMVRELGAEPLTAGVSSAEEHGVLKTTFGYSLVPGLVEGEGQYCSALRKCGADSVEAMFREMPESVARVKGRDRKKGNGNVKGGAALPEDTLRRLFSKNVTFRQKGDTVTAVPASAASDVACLESCLHVVAAGCAVGIMKGNVLVPDADLALSQMLAADAFPSVEVDRETALAYLHRDAITLPDAEKGYVLVKHDGLALGFVKNLGNRCNSLHPQSRRIRMDIKGIR